MHMKPMLSKRQKQVARNLQRVMGDILIQNAKMWFGNKIVTLTKVYVTTDLGLARFYLSLKSFDEPGEILQLFNEQKKALRGLLGQKLKSQMRRIPEIEFFIDDSLDDMMRMDELFNKP